MAPFEDWGVSSTGNLSAAERVVLRSGYEGSASTGNDAIATALRNNIPVSVINGTLVPQHLAEFEQSDHNAMIFEAIHQDSILRASLDIFAADLTYEEQECLAQRLVQNLEGRNLVCLYGTSGTEENSKEIGNIIGSVAYMNANVNPTTGIYFVEDAGHPFEGVVDDEIKFWAEELKNNGLDANSANSVANSAIRQLYSADTSRGIYNPENNVVRNILNYVDNDHRDEVAAAFAELDSSLCGDNIFLGTALNIPAPTVENIENAFEIMNIGEGDPTRTLYLKAAQYLCQNIENASVADFKTVVQGYLMLKHAYDAYGIDGMPVVLTCKWSTMCDITGTKNNLTIYDAASSIKSIYGEGKVLGAACPVTRKELGIKINGEPEMLVDGLDEDEYSPFLVIARHVANIPLALWQFGGNSGKMYYEIMNEMFRNGLKGSIFLDNYERNAPHEGIVKKSRAQTNYLTVLTPDIRVWSVGDDYTPLTNEGETDPNAVLGAAIPSSIQYGHLQSLSPEDRQNTLRRWFEMNSAGHRNGIGAITTREGYASVYYTSKDTVPNNYQSNLSYAAASALMNGDMQQLLHLAESDPALLIILANYNEFEGIGENMSQLSAAKLNLSEQIEAIQNSDEMKSFREMDNKYWNIRRRSFIEAVLSRGDYKQALLQKPIETNVAFWTTDSNGESSRKIAGNLVVSLKNGSARSIQIVEDTNGGKTEDGNFYLTTWEYTTFYKTLTDEINSNLQASISSVLSGYVREKVGFIDQAILNQLKDIEQFGYSYFIQNGNLDNFIEYCINNKLVSLVRDGAQMKVQVASKEDMITLFRDITFPELQELIDGDPERYVFLKEFIDSETAQWEANKHKPNAKINLPKFSGLAKKLITNLTATSHITNDIATRMFKSTGTALEITSPDDLAALSNLIELAETNFRGTLDLDKLTLTEMKSLYDKASRLLPQALVQEFNDQINLDSELNDIALVREQRRALVRPEDMLAETKLLAERLEIIQQLRELENRKGLLERSLEMIKRRANFVYNLYKPFQIEA